MKREDGFTFIELLVALLLVVFIGISTTQAIIQANSVKDKLQREGDLYHEIQISLGLMERDIRHVFHRAQPDKEKPQDHGQDGGQKPDEEGKTSTPFPRAQEEDAKRSKTDIWGTNREIHFTMRAHQQIFEGAPESKISEVGYFLQTNDDHPGLFKLMRRESTTLDGDVREGGEVQELASNLKSLNIRYYNSKEEEWQDKWDTERLDFKDYFPDAIEITMTMVDDKNKEVTFTTIVQILLPNNPERTSDG